MRSRSGFVWDEGKCCIVAEKAVWDPFVENNKSCKSYNRLPFQQFYDLAPVFANGCATGDIQFSGNDRPTLIEEVDRSSDDEEPPPIPLHQMNTPGVEETMYTMINDGVEAKNRDAKKRPTPTSTAGPSGKKKKGQVEQDDDRIVEISGEMRLMRTLIKKSVDTIAKALGESEEYDAMRRDLMTNLAKLEELSRIQRVQAHRRLNSSPSDLKSFFELEEDENKLTLVLDLLGQ